MAATIASPSARGTDLPTPPGRHLAFLPRAELAAPALADLLALDDAAFRNVFAGSPIKRIGRNRMVRNAAIAAGNSGLPSLVPHLQALVDDEDEVVAEAARWALGRLSEAVAARLSAATHEERSISRPSGRRASTWVTTGSAPSRAG